MRIITPSGCWGGIFERGIYNNMKTVVYKVARFPTVRDLVGSYFAKAMSTKH